MNSSSTFLERRRSEYLTLGCIQNGLELRRALLVVVSRRRIRPKRTRAGSNRGLRVSYVRDAADLDETALWEINHGHARYEGERLEAGRRDPLRSPIASPMSTASKPAFAARSTSATVKDPIHRRSSNRAAVPDDLEARSGSTSKVRRSFDSLRRSRAAVERAPSLFGTVHFDERVKSHIGEPVREGRKLDVTEAATIKSTAPRALFGGVEHVVLTDREILAEQRQTNGPSNCSEDRRVNRRRIAVRQDRTLPAASPSR